MRFMIDCELQYDVADDTTLILNIEAQQNDHQRILSERLDLRRASAATPTRCPRPATATGA